MTRSAGASSPTSCRCEQCLALEREAGPETASFYKQRLPVRGWAGSYSEIERVWMRIHVHWFQVLGERGRQNMANIVRKPTATTETGPTPTPDSVGSNSRFSPNNSRRQGVAT